MESSRSDTKTSESPLAAIIEVDLPSIPRQVLAKDLGPDGKLYSEIAIKVAIDLARKKQDELEKSNEGVFKDDFIQLSDDEINAAIKKRYPNDNDYKKNQTKFGAIYHNGQLYAVYSGKKEHYLGEGSEGKVKLVQNQLKPRDNWSALKVSRKHGEPLEIYRLTHHLPHFERLKEKYTDEARKEAEKWWSPSNSTGQIMEKFNEDKNENTKEHTKENQSGKGIYLGFKKHEKKINTWSCRIILPLLSGVDLRNFEMTTGKLQTPIERVNLVLEMSKVFYKLIDEGIVHCDIKLENIMVSNNGKVSLTDFSSSKILDTNNKRAPYEGGVGGTPYYMPPDLLKSFCEITPKIQKLEDTKAECERKLKTLRDEEKAFEIELKNELEKAPANSNKSAIFDVKVRINEAIQNKKKEIIDTEKFLADKNSDIQSYKNQIVYSESTDVFSFAVVALKTLGCELERGEPTPSQTSFINDFPLSTPYKISETNSDFKTQFSKLIPDPAIRKDILAVLGQAVAKDATKRPTMEDLCSQLQEIALRFASNYSYLPARMKNIAMVNVADFIKNGKCEINKDVIAAMKNFHQVDLVASKDTAENIHLLAQIRSELEKNGINVNPKLYQSTKNGEEAVHELVAQMPDYKSSEKGTNSYFYLTDKKVSTPEDVKIVNPKNDKVEDKIHEHLSDRKVTVGDFKKIESSLLEEAGRLIKKSDKILEKYRGTYPSQKDQEILKNYRERHEAIIEWIKDWKPGADGKPTGGKFKDKNYTYSLLMKALDDLGNKMPHTSEASKTLSTLFSKVHIKAAAPKSKSGAAIEEIKSSIKESITSSTKPRARH